MDEAALEATILVAHAALDEAVAGDRPQAIHVLAELYFQAAELKAEIGQEDAAAFLMTHAYVFALDAGDKPTSHNTDDRPDSLAEKAYAYLRERGREV
ncbi:MAG: hypothetical protein AAFO98_06675 [Pseudomonadota bacterium]